MTRAEKAQFLQLVLACAVVGTSGIVIWLSFADHQDDVDGLNQLFGDLSVSTDDAIMGPNDFVSSLDPADRELALSAFSAVRTSLGALELMMPGHVELLERARTRLGDAEQAADLIWQAESTEGRVAGMREFDRIAAQMVAAIRLAEAEALQHVLDTQRNRLAGLSVGAGLALVGYVLLFAFGITSQRRKIAEMSDHCTATAATLERERSHTQFSQNLAEILDLAQTETEIFELVARAARLAMHEHTFQFMLADNSRTLLLPRVGDRTCACYAPSPQGCPALRRGRTSIHLPHAGLARCPRLIADTPAVACTPTSVRGEAIGVFQLVGSAPRPDEMDLLYAMSVTVGGRLGVVRTLTERQLKASTDSLTGLVNRRSLLEQLTNLDHDGADYAVLFADLDHFKRLNDTYGHDAGDRCLRLFGQVLRDVGRKADVPCRFGGEEFVVLLPDTDVTGAMLVAERVRARVREVSVLAGIPFTASIGVAARPSDGDDHDAVLKAADMALYTAKESGRDRVVAWTPDMGISREHAVIRASDVTDDDGDDHAAVSGPVLVAASAE